MKNKIKYSAAALFFFFLAMGCLDHKQQENTNNIKEEYLAKGQQITAAVFSALSSELQNAMKNGGVENAVTYCNLHALNVVDSLSAIHQAQIRRASGKYRNPEDRPDISEKKIIDHYESEIKKGNEIIPKVVSGPDGRHYFYAPIFVNDFCLKCHGTIGQELTRENADLIKKYYPADLATGYETGDFRGIWSIGFEE
ncbi:MAG: DUF3365 domain-containing protein [Bacteroidota bacterium]